MLQFRNSFQKHPPMSLAVAHMRVASILICMPVAYTVFYGHCFMYEGLSLTVYA